MTLYLGENLISGVATPIEPTRNIGQIIQSTIPLIDAGLHLLDGSLINGSGIYSAFVTYISGLVTDYPDLFCTEAEWQTSVNTYGVCGKFVYTEEKHALYAWTNYTSQGEPTYYLKHNYMAVVGENVYNYDGTVIGTVAEYGSDTTGNYFTTYVGGMKFYKNPDKNLDAIPATVRLPKITGKIEGTTDITALGDLIEQFVKLPNITGQVGTTQGNGDPNGAFYGVYIDNNGRWSSGYAREWSRMDASRCSSVYSGNGTDTKIHEQAINVLCYIVIATTTKTDIEVDIDETATDLNGKADVDFVNVNDTAKIAMAHNAMPSDKYIDLTLGASGTTYTAPANGYFCFYRVPNNPAGYSSLLNNINGFITETRNTINGAGNGVWLPVKKDDIISLNYDGGGTVTCWRFYYAVGAESEAS